LRKSAQIGLCDAKIGPLAENIFSVLVGSARVAPACTQPTRVRRADTASAVACEKKALKKSAFAKQRSRAARKRASAGTSMG